MYWRYILGVSIFPKVVGPPAVLQTLTGVLNSEGGLCCAVTRLVAGEGITDWGIVTLLSRELGLSFANDLNIWK